MAGDVPPLPAAAAEHQEGAHAPPSQLHLHTAFEDVSQYVPPLDASAGLGPADTAALHPVRDGSRALRPRSRSSASRLSLGGHRIRTAASRSATASPSSGHGMLDPALLAAAAAGVAANAPRSPCYLPTGASTHVHPDILDDLRALDDLEGGSLLRPLLHFDGGDGSCFQDKDVSHGRERDGASRDGGADATSGGGMHVDEAETYEMQELMEAKKAKDVLQYIEEEGGWRGGSPAKLAVHA
jgi:hypothetical protein